MMVRIMSGMNIKYKVISCAKVYSFKKVKKRQSEITAPMVNKIWKVKVALV